MSKKVTAGQIHKALVNGIEKRWKLLARGAALHRVPSCQLCNLFLHRGACKDCPLSMIGQKCSKTRSAYWKFDQEYFHRSERNPERIRRAANNVIDQLQKCLDTFFPAGLEKGEKK